MAAAIPGGRLLVSAGTGHNPHGERPAAVAHDLGAFVQATVPPRWTAGGS